MYSNILLATDLSRESDELVRCATGLRALGCRRVQLVFGLEIDDIGPARAGLEQIVAGEIEKQARALKQAGIEAAGSLALHPVQQEIERIAAENHCSLLVVGSRTHSLAGEIIAGGVAASLLTTARRPLLMLRLHQPDSAAAVCNCWPCAPLRHILFPTDFSRNAEHAFAYLERFVAEHPPERLTLMHVQDRGRIEPHLAERLDEFNARDRARLDGLQQRLTAAAPSLQLSIELPLGHPAQAITDYCRQTDVALVIMGSQGRGCINELFLGSVSHNVARHAPAPVLLIPAA